MFKYSHGQLADSVDDVVSVVIPNFNGLETLEEAINSVLNQSHPQTQIIVVDDCSTDNSVAFLKQRYKDSRLQIIQHERNRMLGAARNTGITSAEGSYLFFLDADDFLLPDSLKTLLTLAKTHNADIVQGGSQRLTADGKRSIYHQANFISDGQMDGLHYFSDHRFASVAWNKIYRKELFENPGGLRFVERHMHEDVPFAMECAFRARHIVSVSTPVICYTENKKSMTQRAPGRFNIESYAALYFKLADLCQNFDLYNTPAGTALAGRIIKNHGDSDLIPKLLRCRQQMGQDEFEEAMHHVGFSMAGRYGVAAASLIAGLTTLLHAEHKKASASEDPRDPFRSVKRFIKKRHGNHR